MISDSEFNIIREEVDHPDINGFSFYDAGCCDKSAITIRVFVTELSLELRGFLDNVEDSITRDIGRTVEIRASEGDPTYDE